MEKQRCNSFWVLLTIIILLFPSIGLSGDLPPSAVKTLKIINLWQNNQDAEIVGAGPNELLNYVFSVKLDTEDVENYVFSMDISMILEAADILDSGLGQISGTELTYPAVSLKAPCEQKYSFSVIVKNDCGNLDRIISFAEGVASNVSLNCGVDHMNISNPAWNAQWNAGADMLITWENLGLSGDMTISLSREGGKSGTFETIDTVTDDFSYPWTVSGPASDNCVLKIEPVNDPAKAAHTFFKINVESFFDTVAANYLGDPSHKGVSTPSVGFGVNAVNGNFFHAETDAAIPGKDIPFVFSRSYNSLSDNKDSFGGDLPQPFGPGWTHGYNIVLRSYADNSLVEVIWGDGRHDGFGQSNNQWHGDSPGNFSNLSEVENQLYRWELTTKDQIRYRFNSDGRLTEIVGRSGHAMTFAYTGENLTAITDTAGRTITLAYDSGRLTRVDLPPSRHFDFEYTGAGLLDRVIDMRGNYHRYTYYSIC